MDQEDMESHSSMLGQAIYESDSSLLPVAAQLQTVWPSLSLGDLLGLASSLTANAPLLELAARQASEQSKGSDTSTLELLARILFRRPERGSFTFPSAPGLSLVDQLSQQRQAVLLAAHTLNLIPLNSNALKPSSRLTTPNRSIMTHHRACFQCGGVLQVGVWELHDVWVLHPSSVERATPVRMDCATKRCRAKHWPNAVEIKQDGIRVQVLDSDAVYLKLGRHIYAHRSFAISYVALLETNHVSSSSFAELYTRLYGSLPPSDTTPSSLKPLSLRAEHVWRAFVLHSTLELAADASPPEPFVCLAESSTEEIVSMALEAYLSEKTIPGAMDHSCPDCSRYKRRWKAGAKADQGQFAERASGRKETQLVEDTVMDRSRIVKMAVMDGIKIGHAKCAYPPCKSDPLNHTTRRFCIDHEHYHSLCGVYGCDEPRKPIADDDEDEEETEACEREDHQRLREQRVKQKGRMNVMGYSRVVREMSQREKKKAGAGLKRQMEEEDDELAEEDEAAEQDAAGPAGGRKPPQTMWTFGTMAGIQLLIYSCGCPIGWEKFYTPESPEEVLDFLSDICTCSGGELPSFIAYDRACQLLATIEQQPDLHHWLTDAKWICDAFHFAGHSRSQNVLCRTFCDPAPLDGSAPDLVVPMVEERRRRRRADDDEEGPKRVYRRAFNTEAAEQINSWLHGFSFILRQLRADNHDFLLHVLLRRRFKLRAEALEKKHKGVRVG